MKSKKIKRLSLWALFVAVIAATAFISIPTPFGINFTMQIFGVCLAGLCLGVRGGISSVVVYIALGAMGLPVFSFFTGGMGVLVGASGGFLWGFVPVAALCGVAAKCDKKSLKFLICVIAVLLCHALGVIQYSFVSGVSIVAAIVATSLPFLLKDFTVIFLAILTADRIKGKIKG